LVVLTNESVSPDQSAVRGMRVTVPPRWAWQEVVTRCLLSLARRIGPRLFRGSAGPPPRPVVPLLSSSVIPTAADIRGVASFVRKLGAVEQHPIVGVGWRIHDDSLVLHGAVEAPLRAASFFASGAWVEGLPKPTEVV